MVAASCPSHVERWVVVLNHPREAYRSALTGCLAVPRFSQSPAAAAVSAPPPLDSLGPFGCMMEKWFRFS